MLCKRDKIIFTPFLSHFSFPPKNIFISSKLKTQMSHCNVVHLMPVCCSHFWLLKNYLMKISNNLNHTALFQQDRRGLHRMGYDWKLSYCIEFKSVQYMDCILLDVSVTHTLRLRDFIINSLARCVAGWASSGLIIMLLSRGSPGTICQWWNTDRQKAWPCVCVRKSVSNPNESMAGMKALMV